MTIVRVGHYVVAAKNRHAVHVLLARSSVAQGNALRTMDNAEVAKLLRFAVMAGHVTPEAADSAHAGVMPEVLNLAALTPTRAPDGGPAELPPLTAEELAEERERIARERRPAPEPAEAEAQDGAPAQEVAP
jgi:hypothetical protein